MSSRRLGWAIATIGAVFVLTGLNLFGSVSMIVSLAAALACGLLVVVLPTPSQAAPVTSTALSPKERWAGAVSRHNEVLGSYASFELDPAMLLQFPALWDLSAPQIIAFHDALDVAGQLRTDTYPNDSHALKYVAAVNDLRSAWAAAERFARTTGTSALNEDDARDCRRALKLLRHADGAASAERSAYLQQVLATVDRLAQRGVVPEPEPVRRALERKLRKALEA